MSLFDFLFKKTSDAQNIERLTSDAFTKAIQKSNVQLIDVRTPDEFRSGHYKNAKNKLFKERLGDFVGGVFTNAYKPIQNYYSKNELDALSE